MENHFGASKFAFFYTDNIKSTLARGSRCGKTQLKMSKDSKKKVQTYIRTVNVHTQSFEKKDIFVTCIKRQKMSRESHVGIPKFVYLYITKIPFSLNFVCEYKILGCTPEVLC